MEWWAPSLLAVAVAVSALQCFHRYWSASRRVPFTTTTEWRAAFRRHARRVPGTLAREERRAMLRQVASSDAAAVAAVAAFEPADDLPYAEFLRILEQHGTPC